MSKIALLLSLVGISLGASAEVNKYKIDPAHTSVVFKINHLGFASIYGQFPGVEGEFQVDEAKPENSKVEIKIKTDSVTTHVAKRDQHLKSPDFFNTKANPMITFKSTAVKKIGASNYQITGDLTLNGVTKAQTLDFNRMRTGQDPWGKTRTGGDGTFKFKRSDYKMNYMQGENQLSDEVEIMLGVEGIRE